MLRLGFFLFRIFWKKEAGYYIGLIIIFLLIPLFYIFIKVPELMSPIFFYVHAGLVIAWILLKLLLDYILKIDFSAIGSAAISYVVLFFAAADRLIGIASCAGRQWTIISVIILWVTAILSFVQCL